MISLWPLGVYDDRMLGINNDKFKYVYDSDGAVMSVTYIKCGWLLF